VRIELVVVIVKIRRLLLVANSLKEFVIVMVETYNTERMWE
jgi:hypothetical protein